MAWWKWLWRKQEPVSVVTAVGKFVQSQIGGDWEGCASFNGEEIHVSVDDVSGMPDPAFLAQIPNIIRTLPLLEQTARRDVGHLTDVHRLSGITYSHAEPGSTDSFALEFEYDEDTWGETVYVHFEGDAVVDWGAID